MPKPVPSLGGESWQRKTGPREMEDAERQLNCCGQEVEGERSSFKLTQVFI
jgi:hypothetical protein